MVFGFIGTFGKWHGVDVLCSVNNGPDRPYEPVADQDTIDYYGNPGGTVRIACSNSLGQEAQTSFTW